MPEYKVDNPANKWAEQRKDDQAIGEEIDRRKEGEPINNLFGR